MNNKFCNKQVSKLGHHIIFFALGSNLGDRKDNIDKAISMLEQKLQIEIITISDIFVNNALLLEGSPPEWNLEFYNIVIKARINLDRFSPLEIITIIKKIENNLDRVNISRWSPRTIDIDILIIENIKIMQGEILTIPHKELHNRDFFLIPLNQIDKNWQQFLPLCN